MNTKQVVLWVILGPLAVFVFCLLGDFSRWWVFLGIVAGPIVARFDGKLKNHVHKQDADRTPLRL